MDVLATCQTNIACLLEVVSALQSEIDVNGAGEMNQQIMGIASSAIFDFSK